MNETDYKNKRDRIIFIYSLLFINFLNWVSVVEGLYGIPKIIKYALSIIGLGIMIYYRFVNRFKPNVGSVFYPVIVIFVIWSVFLLLSAITKFNSLFYIQRVLGQPLFFLPYLVPILLLYSHFDLDFFTLYFKYSFILIVPAILIQFYIIATGIASDDWEEQNNRILLFDIGSRFLLLTSHYSQKRYIFPIALVYSLFTIFLFTHYGSRGVLMDYSILLFVLIIIRLKSPYLVFIDRLKIYFAGILLVVLILLFGYLMTSTYVFQRGFSKDAFEESRSIVFQDFFIDFSSIKDWVAGRGIDGMVFRSISEEGNMAGYIENGFLTIILKGGLLYLVPYILILLRASYLGFIKSNNDMVKSLAALILIYVLMMFHFNLPAFTTRYIFIWIAVSACFTPSLRNYHNEDIYKALNSTFR